MKLFLITQEHNKGYDSYDSAVVAAPDEKTARQMHPRSGQPVKNWKKESEWCNSPKHVTVRYLGKAINGVELGVVCASFNAG